MRTKFVEGDESCLECCFTFLSDACKVHQCHSSMRNDGKTGHFVEVKVKPKSADRKLLEQIATQGIIMGGGTIALPNGLITKLLDIRGELKGKK